MSCRDAFHEVDSCPGNGILGTCVTQGVHLRTEVRVYAGGLGPWEELCNMRGGTWTAYPAIVGPDTHP
jgi:hypothetical protein